MDNFLEKKMKTKKDYENRQTSVRFGLKLNLMKEKGRKSHVSKQVTFPCFQMLFKSHIANFQWKIVVKRGIPQVIQDFLYAQQWFLNLFMNNCQRKF